MAIQSKFHMARVKPVFDQADHTAAIEGGDILFDWHAFEIPRGCLLYTSPSPRD